MLFLLHSCTLNKTIHLKTLQALIPSLFAVLMFGTCFSQTEMQASEVLKGISSLTQVDSLERVQPNWKIQIKKTLSFGMTHDSALFYTRAGEIVKLKYDESSPEYLYKVIGKGREEVCKVSYIYLNGWEHEPTEIAKIRDTILRQYKAGTPFVELARKYNEDGNETGELEWFYKGMTAESFDSAVRNKSAEGIFVVDIPENNWHYLVLKEEENKYVDCSYSIGIKLCHVGCEDPAREQPQYAATFPGGLDSLARFISENVNYPPKALDDETEGLVVMSFVVEMDGSVSQITVEKGVSFELNEEAKRLIQSMPRWIPAMHFGNIVRSKCRLPINFTLSNAR
jgi:TonB family protein